MNRHEPFLRWGLLRHITMAIWPFSVQLLQALFRDFHWGFARLDSFSIYGGRKRSQFISGERRDRNFMVPLKKGKEKRAQAARSIVTLQVYQISCETLILLSDCIARLKDFQIVFCLSFVFHLQRMGTDRWIVLGIEIGPAAVAVLAATRNVPI